MERVTGMDSKVSMRGARDGSTLATSGEVLRGETGERSRLVDALCSTRRGVEIHSCEAMFHGILSLTTLLSCTADVL